MASYHYHSLGECECDQPPPILNGEFDEDYSDETQKCGSRQAYRCNEGYEFPDGSVTALSTCQFDSQTWTKVPDCIAILGK